MVYMGMGQEDMSNIADRVFRQNRRGRTRIDEDIVIDQYAGGIEPPRY